MMPDTASTRTADYPYRLMILGAGEITMRLLRLLNDGVPGIELVGCVPDESVDPAYLDGFKETLSCMNVPVFPLSDESLGLADFAFTAEYRRIISADIVEKHTIVNCHGGIVPYYRGLSANPYAILNGSDVIGFSFFRMGIGLDDGDIYHVEKIPIGPDQTYSDVHDEFYQRIIQLTPSILLDIASGKLKAVPQSGKCIYCSKFFPEMGDITGFQIKSKYARNLYRSMAKPHGSGIYFLKNNVRYDVGYVLDGHDKNIDDYIGICGKVVNIENDELWVKTIDNLVVLGNITANGARVSSGERFGIGMSLNG